MNPYSKKLFDCLMEIENSQYPDCHQDVLKKRMSLLEKFIDEFGTNHVTINTYTNMMQSSLSITLDVFKSNKFISGDIIVDLGSEPYEIWAKRNRLNLNEDGNKGIYISEIFDFNDWTWNKTLEGSLND